VIAWIWHWSFWCFQENLQIPLYRYAGQRPPFIEKIIDHSYIWINGWELSHMWSIWFRRDFQKITNHYKDHLIFMNFGVRNFTTKSNLKKEKKRKIDYIIGNCHIINVEIYNCLNITLVLSFAAPLHSKNQYLGGPRSINLCKELFLKWSLDLLLHNRRNLYLAIKMR
jgi:hypothetical protein